MNTAFFVTETALPQVWTADNKLDLSAPVTIEITRTLPFVKGVTGFSSRVVTLEGALRHVAFLALAEPATEVKIFDLDGFILTRSAYEPELIKLAHSLLETAS